MTSFQDLEALVGRQLPGGSYTILPERHAALTQAVGGRPVTDDAAHPLEAYFGAIGGMGVTLGDFFSLVGADASDGPMFGEVDLEYHRPLRIGATYAVAAYVESAVRKRGRRIGVFDAVTVRFDLADGEGPAVTVRSSFIFPRVSA